jgi:hypothetical protein
LRANNLRHKRDARLACSRHSISRSDERKGSGRSCVVTPNLRAGANIYGFETRPNQRKHYVRGGGWTQPAHRLGPAASSARGAIFRNRNVRKKIRDTPKRGRTVVRFGPTSRRARLRWRRSQRAGGASNDLDRTLAGFVLRDSLLSGWENPPGRAARGSALIRQAACGSHPDGEFPVQGRRSAHPHLARSGLPRGWFNRAEQPNKLHEQDR